MKPYLNILLNFVAVPAALGKTGTLAKPTGVHPLFSHRHLGTQCESEKEALSSCYDAHIQNCRNDYENDAICQGLIDGDGTWDDLKDDCPEASSPETLQMFCNCLRDIDCVTVANCCESKCVAEYRAVWNCQVTFIHNPMPNCVSLTCPSSVSDPPSTSPPPTPPPTACFSAVATVNVYDKGSTPMKDLQVGNRVLTATPPPNENGKYQQVYAFGHYSPNTVGKFLEITTTRSSAPLEISAAHLIHVAGKSNPVRADSLQVGEVLLVSSDEKKGGGQRATITAIKEVERAGLYAPLTADGTLVVSGVSVSTYVALQDADPEHLQILTSKNGMDVAVNVLSHGQFAHLYMTPFRMFCLGITPSFCQMYDSNGIPHYIGLGIKFGQWVIGTQNWALQTFLLILTMPTVTFLWIVEVIFGPVFGLVVSFVIALAVWYKYKHKPWKVTKKNAKVNPCRGDTRDRARRFAKKTEPN